MKYMLLVFHVGHRGGRTEFLTGPYTKAEAQAARIAHAVAEKAHIARRAALGEQGGPRTCVTQTPPWEWDKKVWGERLAIEVCATDCAECASGEHNEVRDA